MLLRKSDQQPGIRFRTLDDLEGYLDRAGDADFDLRVYPIAGSPETFRFRARQKSLTGLDNRHRFDSPRAFACYAFQSDAEGYSHTEYVDLERLDQA